MFGHWNDFERTFAALDDLRNRMERVFADSDGSASVAAVGTWPRAGLWDQGGSLVFKADVPGLTEKDVQIHLTNDVLTVSGERKIESPSGYSVHRLERLPVKFSRSFTLPCKVNADEIGAVVKDGVLTVTLPKAPESQPRQISVKAA
jgi:HSP20 family protein